MQGANIPVITLDGRRQQIDIYALPAAVGRNGEEADVYLFDESISRIHCRFDVYQGGVTVTDLYSTTGTKVEKQQLNPGQPYSLLCVLCASDDCSPLDRQTLTLHISVDSEFP